MARLLIVYATKQGQTEKIAGRIAQRVRAQGHVAELLDAERLPTPLSLEQFDVVLVGAPIHAGGYPRSIERFAREQRDVLARVPSAFFSVGLAVASRTSDGRAQTREVIEKFVGKTGWRPARVELMAGALSYSKYNVFIRFIMRRIVAKEGGDTDTSRDYEYTDWSAVDRFSAEVMPAPST
jgi:menaquinone-dependent protoporphyrinogen oxidase